MFQEAVDFVLKGFNGAVDILTDLNTVAPIIGIALVGYLILTAVTRLLLPIIGGTLPSGMADELDVMTGRQKAKDVDDKRAGRRKNRKKSADYNKKKKKSK